MADNLLPFRKPHRVARLPDILDSDRSGMVDDLLDLAAQVEAGQVLAFGLVAIRKDGLARRLWRSSATVLPVLRRATTDLRNHLVSVQLERGED